MDQPAAREGDSEDDSDERTPLFGHAAPDTPLYDRLKVGQARRVPCSAPLASVVLIGCTSAVLLRINQALAFPYLRTLQHCEELASASTGGGGAGGWSGSDYCRNRGLVVREAQAETGYVACMGLVLHSLFLPLLGWLGDHYGRKPLIVLFFLGLSVEAALNAAIPRLSAYFLATAVHHATDGLSPALLAMLADVVAPEDRLSSYLLCAVIVSPVYMATYYGVAHYVLAEHMHSSRHTWSLLAAVSAVGALGSLAVPETVGLQTRRPPKADADAEVEAEGRAEREDEAAEAEAKRARGAPRVCLPLRLLLCWGCAGRSRALDPSSIPDGGGGGRESLLAPCAVPALRFVMAVEAPALFGLASFVVLDGFALIAYGWEQETVYYVRLASLPFGGLAVLSSVWMMGAARRSVSNPGLRRRALENTLGWALRRALHHALRAPPMPHPARAHVCHGVSQAGWARGAPSNLASSAWRSRCLPCRSPSGMSTSSPSRSSSQAGAASRASPSSASSACRPGRARKPRPPQSSSQSPTVPRRSASRRTRTSLRGAPNEACSWRRFYSAGLPSPWHLRWRGSPHRPRKSGRAGRRRAAQANATRLAVPTAPPTRLTGQLQQQTRRSDRGPQCTPHVVAGVAKVAHATRYCSA